MKYEEKNSISEKIDIFLSDLIYTLPLIVQILVAVLLAIPMIIYMGLTRNKH